ncbi:O-antigen ligase family protein [Paraglaciecola sp. 25GB23A]|uniref:O-antigen ligase family protein n=1 Tax=Paraglaciecola sp. 25GB23A TaxID=3156068 RepID=UPI0032AF7E8D
MKPTKTALLYITIYLNLFGLFGGYATFLGGTSYYSSIWLAIYALTSLVFFKDTFLHITKNQLILILFIFYIMCSFVWSKIPNETVKYSLSFICNILFAIGLYKNMELNQFLITLRNFLNFYIILGIILFIIGLDQTVYYDPLQRGNLFNSELIKGLFSHKIYAGFYSAFAFILNVKLNENNLYLKYFFCSMCAIGVIISGSSIGLMSLFLYITLATYLNIFERKIINKKYFKLTTLILLVFLVIVYIFLPLILESLNRDMTFTGRAKLWEWGVVFSQQRPIFGWGYSGIFSDLPGAPSQIINKYQYYVAPHFHNGYLQITAELGLIGLAFYLFVLKRTINCCYLLFQRQSNSTPFLYLIVMLIVAIGMNLMSRYNEFSTFFLFYLFLSSNHLTRKL